MSDFSITTQITDGHLLFKLTGELDLATAGQVEEALAATREWDTVYLVVIDMTELEFLDSSGLRALFVLDTAARERGTRAVFVRGPSAVQRIFQVTGLDTRLEMADDLASLLAENRTS